MATNNAAFVSQVLPTPPVYGDLTEQRSVRIVMQNMGDTPWVNFGSNPYQLGDAVPAPNSNGWGTTRVNLTRPVSPGDTYTFEFTIDVSLRPFPHIYPYRWQMVQDGGAGWFGDKTPNVGIQVLDSRR